MDASRFNSKPKWINPCGGEPNAELYTSDLPESRSVDGTDTGKPFESILLAARLAKDTAENFKEKYVQQTFNVGFAGWHANWKSTHFDWLPSSAQIPKSLGEPTPQEHLEKLQLDSALKDIYKYLQMYAVGLEQVTWDQEDIKGDFWSSFKDAEHALKATLCEVQVLMVERNVRQHPDVQRDLMDSNVRQNNSTSHRNLRDWLIYRDYMNGLEYVIEVLEHFERQYPSS
ncbi:hypothetical protein R5R35_006819 [Gryllus longicercus]|uniref:Uncharacterized protein n=2 Tax=Gryllus TaxID=6998 RepID=A0AAN9Z766_9ORTH|nr:Unpaired [Gryllus bimaculatus]